MHGPSILIRSLSTPLTRSQATGDMWQYHSRSDRHSKIACWGIAFDMLRTSALLRSHVEQKKVVLSVQQTLRDYSTGRKKNLDLVIARPAGEERTHTFASLVDRFKILLSDEEVADLAALPTFVEAEVGAVLVALEAKATMTAHIKALPRLYDELNSSHLTVHGASSNALSIAFAMVNAAPRFVSNDLNDFARGSAPAVYSTHAQPGAVERVISKLEEIPRRSGNRGNGFDGLGIVVIDAANDGTPVKLVEGSPAPQGQDPYRYENMIIRMANEYDSTFSHI